MSDSISQYNNISLEDILNRKESLYFERKSIDYRPTHLANDIIWFANANGWIIVVWVHNQSLQDCKLLTNTKYNDLLQACYDYISPTVLCKIEEVIVQDKTILLYHIESNYEKMFQRKDASQKVYLRVWDETKELNWKEVEHLQYDRDLRKFEDQICNEFDEKDLRMTLIDHYKAKLNYHWDFRDLFVSRNLAKKDGAKILYKNSAILLFSEDPDTYIASSYVRYLRFDWDKLESWTSFNVIKDERISGPIPVIIEQLKRFLTISFKDYYYFDTQKWIFSSIQEYPMDAWLEWVVNALTHRSYNRSGNPIYINHFNKMFVINNPWPLPSNVTVDNIQHTRYSRNPRIARVLYELWYVRELNEWVKRIFVSMKEVQLDAPVYNDIDAVVSLTLRNNFAWINGVLSTDWLRRIQELATHLSMIEKNIIKVMLINGSMKMKDLVRQLEKSEPTLRSYLNNLIDKKIMTKHAKNQRDPNAYYSFS
jgi:ATP-dependent DNA helicase RecG